MNAPAPRTLAGLRKAENLCTRCPLYLPATQAVPGEGPARAPLMMVGEQPGNDEDLAGHPFIGPAGRMLDRAIADAGLDRSQIFVTNAVKHFKFERSGKRRLHKRPNAHEIERCKWWNEIERQLIRPQIVVALGATAAHSLMGETVTIAELRGQILALDDGTKLLVTIHPSALLRIPTAEDRKREYGGLVEDLRHCAKVLRAAYPHAAGRPMPAQ
jgi:uracil-DNA glycosylase family protein